MGGRSWWVGGGAALALLAGCGGRGEPASTAAAADAAAAPPPVATCGSLHGAVRLVSAGRAEAAAALPGRDLRAGDGLRTEPRAWARLDLAGGGSLLLGGDSEVVLLGSASTGRPAMIELRAGTVRVEVAGPADAAGTFPATFVTPEGRALSVSAQPGELAVVELDVASGGAVVRPLEGSARLRVGSLLEVAVPSGSLAEVSAGDVRVLEAPPPPAVEERALEARLAWSADGEAPLAWRADEGAAAYRVEVSRDASFLRLEASAETRVPLFSFRPPRPGLYLWRVAAVDARGRRGPFGHPARLHCEGEEPREELLTPAEASSVSDRKAVVFRWRGISPGSWRLVVSSGPDLRRGAVLTRETGEPEVTVRLPPGHYYWGVYAGEGQDSPLFLRARRLTVHRAPEPSDLEVLPTQSDWGT